MSKKELTFIVYLIHQLAEAWGLAPYEVYSVLDKGKIITEYIIPSYDVLHSMGSKYLINDISNMAHERGLR